jgi:hypothetical protein
VSDALLERALAPVQALAFAVHTLDAAEVERTIGWLRQHALADAALVLLAGMVDIDRPVSDLLAWKDEQIAAQARATARRGARLLPCGTPAAYARHRKHGEEPCEACMIANRLRNRDRYQQQLLGGKVVRKPLAPCGTHAAYTRHKKRGEPIDEVCDLGESAYQHERYVARTGRDDAPRRPRNRPLTDYTPVVGSSEPSEEGHPRMTITSSRSSP